MAPHVLIIDNDAVASGELRSLLESHGAEVTQSGQGEAGFTWAESNPPALVVLSAELPDSSGYAICKKFKRSEILQGMPLFMTSLNASPEIFEQHKKLRTRADEYFVKPIDPAEFLEAVGRYIRMPGSQAQRSPTGGFDTVMDRELEDLLDLSDLSPSEGHASSSAATRDADIVGPASPSTEFEDVVFEDFTDEGVNPEGFEDLPLDDASTAYTEEPLPDPEEFGAPRSDDAAGHVVADAGRLPSVSALHHATTMPPASTGVTGGSAALRAELEIVTRDLDRSRQELETIRGAQVELESERDRLARDLDEQRRGRNLAEKELQEARRLAEEQRERAVAAEKAASTAGSGGSTATSREILTLREMLNRKEREVLELKDEIFRRDHELIDLREMRENLQGELATARSRTESLRAEWTARGEELERQLADQRRAAGQLSDEAEAARAERDAAHASIAELEARLERTESGRASLSLELEDVRRAMEALQADLDASRALVVAERERSAELSRDLAEAGQALETERQHASRLRDELAAAGADAETLRGEFDRFRTAAAETEGGLRVDLEQTRSILASARESLATVEAARDTLEAELADRGTRIETLEAAVASRDARVTELEAGIEARDGRIASLDADLAHVRRAHDERVAEIEIAGARMEELEQMLNSVSETLEGERAQREALQTEIGEVTITYETRLAETQSESEAARAQFDQARRSLEGRIAELEAASETARQEHEAAIGASQSRESALRDDLATTRGSLDVASERVEALEADLATAEASLQQRDETIARMQSESDALRSEGDALRSEGESLRATLEATQAIASARAEALLRARSALATVHAALHEVELTNGSDTSESDRAEEPTS